LLIVYFVFLFAVAKAFLIPPVELGVYFR